MTNRLAKETSPYLLQHKDNPVDWYPWGNEAFARARSEDKPVLLSVGYAACHWCHVMEHESFEDGETAALMNESFVNVKVDREERPDVDSLYMNAVQAMTGQGGWPMTVFLTPEGAPFYGGTYFPRHDRAGLPSFKRILRAVSDTWQQQRAELRDQGHRLVEHIRDMTRFEPATGDIDDGVLEAAFERLNAAFDPAYGGFGGAPKFPQPMTVDLLLRLARRGFPGALEMAQRTLDAMASGGMFDQLGGGFHRYSVDRTWTVPHFEKMLYDNAQLLRTYARSWLVTGTPRHREVAEATASWMLREMRDPAGGLWSSLDADSEGVEGKFYVWDLDEVRDAAGEDADAAIEAFGMTREGNFEGLNIPVFVERPVEPASLDRARAALLARRGQRERPGTDTKVLAGWNALAAAALAEAGAMLGRPEWVEAARSIAGFIATELRVDGRLMRSYRDGGVRALACSDDYAFFLEACLVLFETTFDASWLDEARWAADESIRLFLDDGEGGFFTTGSDAEELLLRPKDLFDNAVPSGNSVLALQLQRMSALTGTASYADHAAGAMRVALRAAGQSPTGFGALLEAVDFHTSRPREIVIVGDPRRADTRSLVDEVRGRFLPNKVMVVSGGDGAPSLPLLEGRGGGNGATAYVCEAGVCKLPVTSAEELAAQLDAS
ncbi:MAG TPA: thioredoxin domain-containing protein [Actinomycetota bacterium]|nr:thioredoxin domain-containing protein [Actinomycetota bacterium]